MNAPGGHSRWGLCLAGVLAVAVTGCGGGGGGQTITGVTAVSASSCGPLEYGGEGQPSALVVSDLPLQGDSRERSAQMNDAIRQELDDQGWKAGSTAVAFQACDDSIAKTGAWDPATCRSNARAYAQDPDVIGVIGTYNSGCAALIIPILNQAPGGPVAMVSPGNTFVCLTEPASICKPNEPGVYYPTGTRNYVRIVPNDAAQGAGLAEFANSEGVQRPYVLYAANDPTSLGQATDFRGAASKLGIPPVGFSAWSSKAHSYTGLMNQVKGSGADAVVLAGLIEQNGAQVIKDKVSVLGPNVPAGRLVGMPLLAFDGFTQQSTIDEAKGAAAGMFASLPGRAPQDLTGPGKTFVAHLQQKVGRKPVELFAPYAGEAAQVMLDAIDQGGTDRSAVVKALFGINERNGLVGSFKEEPSGDPSVTPITVSVAGKTFKPVHEVTPPAALIAAARGG